MKALGIKLWEISVRTPTPTPTGTVKGGTETKGKPYWGPPGRGAARIMAKACTTG